MELVITEFLIEKFPKINVLNTVDGSIKPDPVPSEVVLKHSRSAISALKILQASNDELVVLEFVSDVPPVTFEDAQLTPFTDD
jgi:hypothetical protein